MSTNYYQDMIFIEKLISDKLYTEAIVQIEKLTCPDAKLYFTSKIPNVEKLPIKTLGEYGLTKISDFNEVERIPGISIVTCCMNRNENLKKAIVSWLKLKVDEIVIVDWSSDTSVAQSLAEFKDERIKIVEVKSEPRWILTYGFNVGLQFASYTKIFKLDADITVSPDFLLKNTFSQGSYIRGSWKKALELESEDQVFVNGSFGAYHEDLKQIGYYNELIRTYGWDDSDLYERLSSEQGLASEELNHESIYHMYQCPSERTKYQDLAPTDFMGKVESTDFNNFVNKFIARTTTHWNRWRLQDYSVKRKSSQIWELTRITNDVIIPKRVKFNADLFSSSYFLRVNYPVWNEALDDIHEEHFLSFILSEYYAEVEFKDTKYLFTSERAFLIDDSNDIIEYKSTDVLFCLANDYSRKVHMDNNNKIIEVTQEQLQAINKLRTRISTPVIGYHNPTELKRIQEKKRIYIDAQHGLGNRLRAIGSAAAIAKGMNRELVIVWQPDHHCECHFSDLFDYSGLVIGDLSEIDLSSMHKYNYMEIEDNSNKGELISDIHGRDLYLRSAYVFNSPYSYWESENEFIRSLKPNPGVTEIVDSIDVSNCIAAHIRMEAGEGLDHNSYDSIDNWSEDDHQKIHYWREKSHYSNFIKRIDEIISGGNSERLFLATDLPETYEIFNNYYSNKIVFLNREKYDRSAEQIKYALADVILLSKCNKLLGSTWSSFSELAMRMSTTYTTVEMSGEDF